MINYTLSWNSIATRSTEQVVGYWQPFWTSAKRCSLITRQGGLSYWTAITYYLMLNESNEMSCQEHTSELKENEHTRIELTCELKEND